MAFRGPYLGARLGPSFTTCARLGSRTCDRVLHGAYGRRKASLQAAVLGVSGLTTHLQPTFSAPYPGRPTQECTWNIREGAWDFQLKAGLGVSPQGSDARGVRAKLGCKQALPSTERPSLKPLQGARKARCARYEASVRCLPCSHMDSGAVRAVRALQCPHCLLSFSRFVSPCVQLQSLTYL